jgi:serine/threonine protein kinase
MEILIGKNLGRYKILEEIGQGGMTTVYRARLSDENREVAVKVLSPALVQDPKFKSRFEREIVVLQKLEHPNIMPILDYGEHNGSLFIVMPLFTSGTLNDRLETGPLTPQETSRLMNEITGALAHAHEQGIVHRDVKPSNILIDEKGNSLLTDFGLAYLDTTSQNLTGSALIGTPAYMAPEQCRGDTIDASSDQYSLGVVLYHLVTGNLPFKADTPIGIAIKHVNDPLPRPRLVNPDLPQNIEAVIIKALAKDPSKRFASVSDFNNAFQEAFETSMDPSRKSGVWASRLYLVTQALNYVQAQGGAAVVRSLLSQRKVRAGLVLLLFVFTFAAYALIDATANTPNLDMQATVNALYTENAPLVGIPQEPGNVETAVAGTLSVLQTEMVDAELEGTPLETLMPSSTYATVTPTATGATSSPTGTQYSTPFQIGISATPISTTSIPPTSIPPTSIPPTEPPPTEPPPTLTPRPTKVKKCNPAHPCTPTPNGE